MEALCLLLATDRCPACHHLPHFAGSGLGASLSWFGCHLVAPSSWLLATDRCHASPPFAMPYQIEPGRIITLVWIPLFGASHWLLSTDRCHACHDLLRFLGSGLGTSLPLFGYPLVEALFGLQGVRHLVLVDLANSLAGGMHAHAQACLHHPSFGRCGRCARRPLDDRSAGVQGREATRAGGRSQ